MEQGEYEPKLDRDRSTADTVEVCVGPNMGDAGGLESRQQGAAHISVTKAPNDANGQQEAPEVVRDDNELSGRRRSVSRTGDSSPTSKASTINPVNDSPLVASTSTGNGESHEDTQSPVDGLSRNDQEEGHGRHKGLPRAKSRFMGGALFSKNTLSMMRSVSADEYSASKVQPQKLCGPSNGTQNPTNVTYYNDEQKRSRAEPKTDYEVEGSVIDKQPRSLTKNSVDIHEVKSNLHAQLRRLWGGSPPARARGLVAVQEVFGCRQELDRILCALAAREVTLACVRTCYVGVVCMHCGVIIDVCSSTP